LWKTIRIYIGEPVILVSEVEKKARRKPVGLFIWTFAITRRKEAVHWPLITVLTTAVVIQITLGTLPMRNPLIPKRMPVFFKHAF